MFITLIIPAMRIERLKIGLSVTNETRLKMPKSGPANRLNIAMSKANHGAILTNESMAFLGKCGNSLKTVPTLLIKFMAWVSVKRSKILAIVSPQLI
jgi:hypothetical protein